MTDYWHQKAIERQNSKQLSAISWLDMPFIQRNYLNPRTTGSPEVGWFEWVVKSYLPNKRHFVKLSG